MNQKKTIRKKEFKKDVLDRLNYAKGHLDGVVKMVDNDKYCIDIIWQNRAVISAISKINDIILENHLNSCVVKAIKGRGTKERKEKIEEILRIYKEKNK